VQTVGLLFGNADFLEGRSCIQSGTLSPAGREDFTPVMEGQEIRYLSRCHSKFAAGLAEA
jgi:hypothetical protein